MKEPIIFFVPGKPEPAGSKRAFALKQGGRYTGRVAVTDANKNSKGWKAAVRKEAERAYTEEPWDCPIRLIVRFTLLQPKSHFRTGRNAHLLREDAPRMPISKPDTTKLLRGVEDALTGILWRDDAQIVHQTVSKAYGHRQGAVIEVHEMEPTDPVGGRFPEHFREKFAEVKAAVAAV